MLSFKNLAFTRAGFPARKKNVALMVGDENDQRARIAASCLSRRYLCDGDTVLTGDGSAENRAWLAGRYPGRPVRVVPAVVVEAAILTAHGEVMRREAVEGLARRLPELSAHRVVTPAQGWLLGALAGFILACLLLWPQLMLSLLVLALTASFIASGLFRAGLALIGAGRADAAPPLPRHGLPSYTILVPLYREAAVLPGLVAALGALE